MVWNPGISYGLLPQGSAMGKALLIGFAVAAIAGLTVWLARVHNSIGAAAIGALESHVL